MNILLSNRTIAPLQAMSALHCIYPQTKSREFAHATAPIAYKLWTQISSHIADSRDSFGRIGEENNRVLKASWALQESTMMWRKGLKDLAIANINSNVVFPLQSIPSCEPSNIKCYGSASSSSSSSTSSSSSSSSSLTSASNNHKLSQPELERDRLSLLSNALRLGGEWISTKRAATGTEILQDYLLPASRYAVHAKEKLLAHKTLGSFHARLHQNLVKKV